MIEEDVVNKYKQFIQQGKKKFLKNFSNTNMEILSGMMNELSDLTKAIANFLQQISSSNVHRKKRIHKRSQKKQKKQDTQEITTQPNQKQEFNCSELDEQEKLNEKIKKEKEEYNCLICDKTFSTRKRFRQHQSRTHSEKTIECQWEGCNKLMRRRDNYQLHLQRHTIRENQWMR